MGRDFLIHDIISSCAGENNFEANATTANRPSSRFCDKTAPIPNPDASVCITNSRSYRARTNNVAWAISSLISSNAFSSFSPHSNFLRSICIFSGLPTNACSGAAISLNLGTCLLKNPANPKNAPTCFTFPGLGILRIASTFSASTSTVVTTVLLVNTIGCITNTGRQISPPGSTVTTAVGTLTACCHSLS
eukprot:TRINITY_DN4814_c0_g1_i1.p2 TRINITY_DN4814_c0_g1~~TRINITY_DN4814_c0_g1_i1.p2  ORF type:complete len:191 (-),score=10.74 TRINITY_DN4814_c0_g1_i1:77-649(-)